MAAAVRALNAKIRSNPMTDYLCSTHFWGPASNFGIPLAAVADTQKDPDFISGRMTCALLGYSGVFMRYSLMVTPKNWLLFACHSVNFTAQSVQAYRFTNHFYMGGKEKIAEEGKDKVQQQMEKVGAKAEGVVNQAKEKTGDVKAKVEKSVGR